MFICVLLEFERGIAQGGSFKCLQTGVRIDGVVLQVLEQDKVRMSETNIRFVMSKGDE